MNAQSEHINELAKALAVGQSNIAMPKKTGQGNFGKYRTLEQLRDAIIPPLNKEGIAVLLPLITDDGKDYVEMKLLHSSGQWLSFRTALKLDKPSMQAEGSASTYARRYLLESIGGGDEIDDDGNAAEKDAPKSPLKFEEKFIEKLLPKHLDKKISEPQRKRLFTIAGTNGWGEDKIKTFLVMKGFLSSKDILVSEYDSIIDAVSKPPQ